MKTILSLLAILTLGFVLSVGIIFLIQFLWGTVMVEVFGWPTLDLSQTAALVSLLFFAGLFFNVSTIRG